MASTPSKVKSPALFAHVVLRTSPANFPKMVTYYKDFLGAHASFENDMISFLTYDEEHHRVAIVGVPGTTPRAKDSAGMDHTAFTFSSLSDLAQAYRQRKALGILPSICLNHGPTTSIYYTDPDGNKIETQVDNFESVEAATEFMMSEEFAINPIGTDFDPDELCERLERGEPEKEIKKRKEIGPRGLDSFA
jgi:catechol-2,3-dioxygenase